MPDLATGLGEGLGAMAAGTASLADVGSSMVGVLAGVLEQVGQLAIQTGIAVFGIQTALQAALTTPGAGLAAIAAGVALIALSKAVQSKMANAGGGGGGGGVPAFANGGVVDKPTLGIFGEAGPEVLIPKQRLDNLLSGFEGGGTAAGGTLTTRITGNDLEIILDKTRRKNNRVR